MILGGTTDVSVNVCNHKILQAAAELVLNIANIDQEAFISSNGDGDRLLKWNRSDYEPELVTIREIAIGDKQAIEVSRYLKNLSSELSKQHYEKLKKEK